MKTRHIGVIIFSVFLLLFQSAAAQAALVAPTNLGAMAVSSSQINLSWTDTNSGKDNESGYSVERSNSPDTGFVKIGSVGKNITTYNNTGLASGTTYYYRVQATGRQGAVSPYSNVANATTNQADITPPTVPTGLTATAASCSQINLSWSASSDTGGSGLKGYNVYKNGAYLKQVTTTSTTDTGLNASTSYSYTVSAVDNAGNQSVQSSPSSATTPSCPDVTPPTVPTELTATATSCSQINLSWSASTDTGGSGLKGYNVYKNGAYLKQVTMTSTTDTGLNASTSYSYTVSAVDNAGNQSAQSSPSSATTPACPDTIAPTVPTGLTATAASCSQINLSWTASTDTGGSGLKGYNIYKNGAYLKQVTTTSISDMGLAASTPYSYTVSAVDNAGNQSTQSSASSATTPACPDATAPSVPTGLTATATSCSEVSLSWSASTDTGGSGLKGYNVYKNGAYLKQVTTTSTTDTGLNASTSYSYTVSAIDNAGNQSAQSSPASANTPACDTTPPTGSITINSGAAYANTLAVTLTLSASDNSGSVSQMCISNTSSCTAWETFATSKAWTLTTGDGTKTVSVWYKDGAGNTSTSCPDTIILDMTPPNSSITINGGSAYTNTTSVTLTLSSADNLSGVSQMCISNTSSCTAWETYATTRAWTLTTGDGTKTVYVWYKDGAGNISTLYSDTIILDTTAPTNGTLSATAGNAQISLSWSGFSDATSGIGSYKLVYSTGGYPNALCTSGNQIYSGTNTSYTHTTLTNGTTYYYRVCAIDNAQNTSLGITANATPAGTQSSWSMSTGSPGDDRGQAVAVDDSGNVVMTGYFSGVVDFGGGALNSNAYPWADPNQITDVFVVKYLATGEHLWSRRIGGVANDRGLSIAVDSSGDVVVSGYCANPVDFGNGVPVSGSTGTDIFVAKYSGASGGYMWAKRFGGESDDYGYGVAVAANGDIFITGQFQGTVDFGGGPLGSAGSSDIFIAKYTATGAYVWAKRIGGIGSEYGYGVAVDNSGDVIIIGRFSGTLDLGVGAVTCAGGYDSFIAKYSGANGGYQWSRVFGSTGYDYANGVAVDGSGNVLVTGQFQGTVNFGGSALMSAGSYDIFTAKYSGLTGSHVWSKRFGSTSSDYGNGIAIDEVGNVIMIGAFYGTVDFGGGPLVSSGLDVVVAKYTSSGSHMWSEKFGGAINQFGDDVAVNGGSNIAVTGYFENVIDFGYGTHTSVGSYDIFLSTLEP